MLKKPETHRDINAPEKICTSECRLPDSILGLDKPIALQINLHVHYGVKLWSLYALRVENGVDTVRYVGVIYQTENGNFELRQRSILADRESDKPTYYSHSTIEALKTKAYEVMRREFDLDIVESFDGDLERIDSNAVLDTSLEPVSSTYKLGQRIHAVYIPEQLHLLLFKSKKMFSPDLMILNKEEMVDLLKILKEILE